jgi:hypothetical protein
VLIDVYVCLSNVIAHVSQCARDIFKIRLIKVFNVLPRRKKIGLILGDKITADGIFA